MVESLVGRVYGRWTVIERGKNDKNSNARWLCQCNCPKHTVRLVLSHSLKKQTSLSCGCAKGRTPDTYNSERNIYAIWNGMIRRCENPRYKDYKNYGGRGIKVCQRWRDSFRTFVEDMGERPSKEHSLDRMENDGDYGPDNCRWATTLEQQKNRRPVIHNSQHDKIIAENVILQQTLKELQARLELQKIGEDSRERLQCQVAMHSTSHLQYPMFDNL